MNWQPMATAPKDGSRVLIWNDQCTIAYWDRGMQNWRATGGIVKPDWWMALPKPPEHDIFGETYDAGFYDAITAVTQLIARSNHDASLEDIVSAIQRLPDEL